LADQVSKLKRIIGLPAALALLTLTGACAGGAASPTSAPSPEAASDFMLGLSQVDARSVALASQLGVRWLRPTVRWADVEPVLGQPGLTVADVKANPALVDDYSRSVDWSAPDAQLSSMSAAGLRAFVVVGHGYASRLPRWNGAAATPDAIGREAYLGRLYLHVRAVVERYDGDGRLDAAGVTPVHHWQVENELNQAYLTALWGWREPSFERAPGSAWQDWDFLTRLLATLVDAVKESDPSALTAVNFHTDVSDALSARLGQRTWRQAIQQWSSLVDIVGIDAYPNYYRAQPPRGSALGDRVSAARQLAGAKPVVVLETGYPSGPAVEGYDEASQEAYIRAAYASAVAAGARGYFHFGSLTSESHAVEITPEDLENLAHVGAAYDGEDVDWLIGFSLTRSGYLKGHFVSVLQAVEGYWGLVRADGSPKPSWGVVQELAGNHP
jgi:hypothetical protein